MFQSGERAVLFCDKKRTVVLSWLNGSIVSTALGTKIAVAHDEPEKAAATKGKFQANDAPGTLPRIADGKPLNLDFEIGTLKG